MKMLSRNGLVLVVILLCAVGAKASELASRVEQAIAFIEQAEQEFLAVAIEAERTSWVNVTHITDDTDALAAKASSRMIELMVNLAGRAATFEGLELPPEISRKLERLRLTLTLPAPSNREDTEALTAIAASMKSTYGKGKFCDTAGECRDLVALGRIMAESRDAAELLETWIGWRTISPPMRADFGRYVELANRGANELGFADLGAMWRSKYDMEPDAFAAELDRLWQQVLPLYEALHCHVRARLAEVYGEEVVDLEKPIPAHLVGNMWAQSWGNIFELVAPRASTDTGYDLTELLREHEIDEMEMVRIGERFFTSLGFEPLPESFWQRSQFTKPRDREVVCHASAWDIDWVDDLRIKMCIEITDEDFQTIHHELGHNFYQRAYNGLPPLFRDSANDGFHEAVGDTVALSITPSYLVEIGLLDEQPAESSDLGQLLRLALDKVAFLPFGLLIDQWRWKVFSGEIEPDAYNESWWRLRGDYQGIEAPTSRTEADFDPGAKYHVPANVPYTRYFLAHILQFQLHRSLCETAGVEDALHRCSIYGNKEVGAKLEEMLALGQSRPWPEALEAVAGSREMDATAILDYFAPLAKWLEKQNENRVCGW